MDLGLGFRLLGLAGCGWPLEGGRSLHDGGSMDRAIAELRPSHLSRVINPGSTLKASGRIISFWNL